MAGEILTGSMLLPFLSGDRCVDMMTFLSSMQLLNTWLFSRWRYMRRAAHEGFSVRASTTYQPLQEKESALLASHMLRSPTRWNAHLKRSAASTVLSAIYGWLPIDNSADTLVERINALAARIVRACLPGAYLVEIFPSMLYLPEWGPCLLSTSIFGDFPTLPTYRAGLRVCGSTSYNTNRTT